MSAVHSVRLACFGRTLNNGNGQGFACLGDFVLFRSFR